MISEAHIKLLLGHAKGDALPEPCKPKRHYADGTEKVVLDILIREGCQVSTNKLADELGMSLSKVRHLLYTLRDKGLARSQFSTNKHGSFSLWEAR